MEGIFLLLGSNLGDRENILAQAIVALDKNGIKVVKKSSIYETAAWGKTDQQAFLNQVLQIETFLDAHDLLKLILEIELQLGRVRKVKWGERIIDIDILYFNDVVYQDSDLEIPHPGIPYRRFTLIPLVEIYPNFIHPAKHISQKELLDNCEDNLEVSLFEGY
ncbi:2-amino-4-hydroxy-6-hydroxymethyldihydropteridine diphosphokinase [Marivirga sp.]|uniref:2-amino-4-hydroxy-6- hydroxymethyldihydropteridine diphosphokinase n=1 Tax=Marivirga sp. TaxID=2018662 RepID=UPI0025E6FBE5|nr:2-amino-4-hydroxy-6-hydroxymethyldihydropteridine diphosphokinase [Marivirga sp.]